MEIVPLIRTLTRRPDQTSRRDDARPQECRAAPRGDRGLLDRPASSFSNEVRWRPHPKRLAPPPDRSETPANWIEASKEGFPPMACYRRILMRKIDTDFLRKIDTEGHRGG
jgi:hypothetical protein